MPIFKFTDKSSREFRKRFPKTLDNYKAKNEQLGIKRAQHILAPEYGSKPIKVEIIGLTIDTYIEFLRN